MFGNMINMLTVIAIILVLSPILAYGLWALGKLIQQKSAEHASELQMRDLLARVEAEKPSADQLSALSAQRGRYDPQVEELLESRQYSAARTLCTEGLDDEGLDEERRVMYERYLRILQEEFMSGGLSH